MHAEDTQDLSNFILELQKETDRGLPLVGTSVIDEKLKDILKAYFIDGKISNKLLYDPLSPLATFSARLDTCFSLGLIDEYEHSEINILRKVRNEFAHAKHGITFKTPKIAGLCSSLKSDLPGGENYPLNDPRFRFKNAIICIVLQLYYRPDVVGKQKRKFDLPEQFRHKWVSVKDELPPEGTPVIVMAKDKQK